MDFPALYEIHDIGTTFPDFEYMIRFYAVLFQMPVRPRSRVNLKPQFLQIQGNQMIPNRLQTAAQKQSWQTSTTAPVASNKLYSRFTPNHSDDQLIATNGRP